MRALLAAQHALARAALADLLRNMFPGAELWVMESQEAAAAAVRRRAVDLIVTDWVCHSAAPQYDLACLVDGAAPGRVIVFGECGLAASVRQAIAAGAHGYIPASSGLEVIAAAISLVAAGGAYFPSEFAPEALAGGAGGRDMASPSDTGERFTPLTAREREVLTALVDGLRNKAIAQRLGISPRTVEVHRAHLMRKTGVGTLSGLIRLALASNVAEMGGPTPLEGGEGANSVRLSPRRFSTSGAAH
ncbi:response regulator transcription factor [Phenylobacterium sp.]|uniref:response regulator transcription factor n=1 Tax=Phenylobacterium sp. TaxID=1871053 RepID=UPI002CC3E64E|nr:response regulator transcription factor [Phenylobacterium sp.]HLZ74155.1 response regulator transcription factor [Phenylobacterium sp.]